LRAGRQGKAQERHRLKLAEEYIPTPPGVTYWVRVQVGDRQIWQPTTQPLPSMRWHDLRDEDRHALIGQARKELEGRARRGEAWKETAIGGVMVCGLEAAWSMASESERRELCQRFRDQVMAALGEPAPGRPSKGKAGRPRKAKGE
jgi:hypothetical protein